MMQALYAYERLALAGQLETVTKASDLRTRTLGNLVNHPPPNQPSISKTGIAFRREGSLYKYRRLHTDNHELDLSISCLETEQHQALHDMPSKLLTLDTHDIHTSCNIVIIIASSVTASHEYAFPAR